MITCYRHIFSCCFILFACIFGFSLDLHATQAVGQFEAIGIPVPHSQQGVKNVWDDVTVTAKLTGPHATSWTIGGFYFATDLWMVRFAPDDTGVWKYQISVSDRGSNTTIQDSFVCVPSNAPGFIVNGEVNFNPSRWVLSSNDKPFYGIGFGDCMQAPRDSVLELGGIDGGYRPKGYHAGIEWNIPYTQYMTAYGDVAGFNLYRYSDGNCAYSMVKQIAASGNDYDTLHSRWTDTLFSALRQHGFHIYMTILSGPVGNSSDSSSMAAVCHYAQYCINRYGSLIDFWELTNESTPDSLWISTVAEYIRTHDPYRSSGINQYAHQISISWQQPKVPAIEIVSPHWYGKEDARNSDQTTADQINQYSASYKPVIFGEQGDGSAWDSLSAVRMRGRIWSAVFNAGTIIFWNSSFAKDCCNQYLGWEERRYVRVLNNFTRLLDPLIPQPDTPRTIGSCRVWQIASAQQTALYIRNFQDVNTNNVGLNVPITISNAGEAIWYDIHTGDILERKQIIAGTQVLTSPPFQTDIAFIAGQFADSLITDTLFRLDVNPRTYQLLGNTVGVEQIIRPALTNIGTSPITIERGFTSSPSSNGSLVLQLDTVLPITLTAGQSITIPIKYKMLDTGGTAAMFSFEHSASPAWENIAISATATVQSSVSKTLTNNDLSLNPNPVDQYLSIRLSRNEERPSEYEIYSLLGQKLLGGTLTAQSLIDVHILSDGTYTLLVKNGERVRVAKFSVLR